MKAKLKKGTKIIGTHEGKIVYELNDEVIFTDNCSKNGYPIYNQNGEKLFFPEKMFDIIN